MHRIVKTCLIACGAALLGGPLQAQTPPAPPPGAGGTADGIPFDVPYGADISLDTARKLVAAVEAEAAKHRWKMSIAVVDTHGELVTYARMEGAQFASGNVSQGKARTSARFRRESRVFYNVYETGHPYISTLDPTLVASPAAIR